MRAARLDATDWRILRELQADGRITNVELAELVNLSPSPCLMRVKKLQAEGYIVGYSAQINIAKLGQTLTVFTEVTLKNHRQIDFAELSFTTAEVLEHALQARELRSEPAPTEGECHPRLDREDRDALLTVDMHLRDAEWKSRALHRAQQSECLADRVACERALVGHDRRRTVDRGTSGSGIPDRHPEPSRQHVEQGDSHLVPDGPAHLPHEVREAGDQRLQFPGGPARVDDGRCRVPVPVVDRTGPPRVTAECGQPGPGPIERVRDRARSAEGDRPGRTPRLRCSP